MLYDYETEVKKLNCTKPLYISNQLTILSLVLKQDRPSAMDIFNAFNYIVWINIIIAFWTVVLVDTVTRNTHNGSTIKRMLNLVWIYFPTLIGKQTKDSRFTNIVYLFWIISVIPLVEIFKNELLANIVAIPSKLINTIEDLLD